MSRESESSGSSPTGTDDQINNNPHVDGLTRGTIIEYDGWQWGVVTEIAEEKDPTKIGFVLLDEISDDLVPLLEEASRCPEHYKVVEAFRGSEHEYWTDIQYVLENDIWGILGPTHPSSHEPNNRVEHNSTPLE
ncbi:hypothetical protein EXE48_11540 [Halorubrum sp. ASP1]|nr:hypothetical protein EXE48_11540 [Halorubrum sp. ASP1]